RACDRACDGAEAAPARRADGRRRPRGDRAVGRVARPPQGALSHGAGRARHDGGLRPRRPHLGAHLRPHPRKRDARCGAQRSSGGRGVSWRRDGVTPCCSFKLAAAYGPAQVLFDVNFSVAGGEVVTLLGRNGMGKTTTIRTLMGLVRAGGGSVIFDGRTLIGLPPFAIAQAGLGLVPEGRQIFPTLTVEENLVATAAARFGAPRWTLDRVYAFF